MTLPVSSPQDALMVIFCGASVQTHIVVCFSEVRWPLAFHPTVLAFRTHHPVLAPPSHTPNLPSPETQVLTLTGNTELLSPLHSHIDTRDVHLTGEVGAIVLRPGCEVQL